MNNLISDLNKSQDNLEETLKTLLEKFGPNYVLATLAQVSYQRADLDPSEGKTWNDLGLALDELEGNLYL